MCDKILILGVGWLKLTSSKTSYIFLVLDLSKVFLMNSICTIDLPVIIYQNMRTTMPIKHLSKNKTLRPQLKQPYGYLFMQKESRAGLYSIIEWLYRFYYINQHMSNFQMGQEAVVHNIGQGVDKVPEEPKEDQQPPEVPQFLPFRQLKEHYLSISRPQYKRTCGISSIVSIWNYQFSRLGLGNRDPICVEQAMLTLNLIGKGSIQQGMRKNFKKAGQLTEKTENSQPSTDKIQPTEQDFTNKSLHEYVNSVDFGCFTGNDTLLRWYRLLCRTYGGTGRSYYFYKTNSQKSWYKNEHSAKKALVEGLNKDNVCFIYHAYDHYFCPLGYQFVPKNDTAANTFESSQVNEEGSELFVMVGESSKMFPGIHVFKWSDIQLDLQTYWPKYFNIRRAYQGVYSREMKQNQVAASSTMDCLMCFQKIKD